jgi:hypothetical protein
MIATDGHISVIMLSAMRSFPHSEKKIQEAACVALRTFLLSADNNAALVRFQAEELKTLANRAASKIPR